MSRDPVLYVIAAVTVAAFALWTVFAHYALSSIGYERIGRAIVAYWSAQ